MESVNNWQMDKSFSSLLVASFKTIAATIGFKLSKVIFLFFTMANIGFPGTSSFVGEFLILTGSFQTNISITLIGATSIVISGCYSLWLFNRIVYGNLKTQYFNAFLDLNKLEFLIFAPLVSAIILMGLLPAVFLNCLHMSVNNLIEIIYF